MSKIIYTTHAKERMKLRKISNAMIKNVIINPDSKEISSNSRKVYYKKNDIGVLKIVFVDKKDVVIIISAIWHVIDKK